MIVGVTTRLGEDGDRRSLDLDYTSALEICGATPVGLVPSPVEGLSQLLETVNGVVLTGGQDISPHFPEKSTRPTGYRHDPLRDSYEKAITLKALEMEIPILGICRGCQIIWTALGGKLINNLANEDNSHVQHLSIDGTTVSHVVHLERDSIVGRSYDSDEPVVVSSHRQGIDLKNKNSHCIVTARDQDGYPEAIEIPSARWACGVLWHPERTPPGQKNAPFLGLFSSFVQAGRK